MKYDYDNMIGNRYGNLVIVSRAEDIISNQGQKIPRFLCRCDCGNEKIIRARYLLEGKTISCGCEKKLIGQKFGHLLVVKEVEHPNSYGRRYLCKCDCGKYKEVNGDALKRGLTLSCGCRYGKNWIGERFGRLVVIDDLGMAKYGNYKKHKLLCKCDCGKETEEWLSNLLSGMTKSCGCLHKEVLLSNITTHNHYHTRLHRIWAGIKARCYIASAGGYENYGGRGIEVCAEWRNDFQAFYNWAMANGYSDTLTIERINNNGNYEPNNCRWATRIEQANNKRNNRLFTYKGETLTAPQIERKYKINYSTFLTRLETGMSVEEAIETPILGKENDR